MYRQPKQALTGLPGFNNFYLFGGGPTPIYKYGGYVSSKIGDATFNHIQKQYLNDFRMAEQRRKDNSSIIMDRPYG